MPNKIDPLLYSKKIIASYLKSFSDERAAVLRSDDIEPLHRMRVASRRLRAALDVFRDLLDPRQAEIWKKKIGKIGQVLGRARELDVQIKFLKTLPGTDAAALTKLLKKERRRAQKKIISTLANFQTDKELSGLFSWLRERPTDKQKFLKDAFHSHRKKIILNRLDKLLSLSLYVDKPHDIKKLHQMRIAAKKMRYTLELLRPWYGTKSDRFIRASRDIQDILGDLHELDVMAVILSDFSKTSPLTQKCARLRKDVYVRFVRMWKRLETQNLWATLRRMV